MWFNHIKPGAVKILMHMIISFFLLWYIWHILLCEYNRKVSSHCNQSPLFVWWRLVFGNKALVPVDGCFSIVVLLLYSCTLILYIFNSDPTEIHLFDYYAPQESQRAPTLHPYSRILNIKDVWHMWSVKTPETVMEISPRLYHSISDNWQSQLVSLSYKGFISCN